MNYRKAVALGDSLSRPSPARRVRKALLARPWELIKIFILLALLMAVTRTSPLFLMSIFLLGMLAGLFVMVGAIDRNEHQLEMLVRDRLQGTWRQYCIDDWGVELRLTRVQDPGRPGVAGENLEETDLHRTAIAWSLIEGATRDVEGWNLALLGGDEIFVPAAVLNDEVDAFIRAAVRPITTVEQQ